MKCAKSRSILARSNENAPKSVTQDKKHLTRRNRSKVRSENDMHESRWKNSSAAKQRVPRDGAKKEASNGNVHGAIGQKRQRAGWRRARGLEGTGPRCWGLTRRVRYLVGSERGAVMAE